MYIWFSVLLFYLLPFVQMDVAYLCTVFFSSYTYTFQLATRQKSGNIMSTCPLPGRLNAVVKPWLEFQVENGL